MAEIVSIQFQTDSERADRDVQELVNVMRRLGVETRRASGETRKQSSAERQRGRDLDRSTRSTQRASTANRNLERGQRRLNTSLRSAAKYAAGAAAGYIGISAAKNAVTTTSELAKATLTLSQNLGLSTKFASEFAARARVRGADARQVGIAFTTLSRQIEAAKAGTESSIKPFQDLGISLKQLREQTPEETIFSIADGLKELGPGYARTADQQKLFGRGAMSIVPILRDGSDALREQLGIAGQLGASFSRLGIEDMKDLLEGERRMKLATLGLQIAFTQAAAPAIDAVTNELVDLGKILNDPKLSADQKADRIADEFARLLTRLVEESTERAPKIAGAFVKGFLSAPIWSQFIAGGLLLAKFGGLPTILGKEGGKAGRSYGKNFALGLTAALLTVELGKQIKTVIEGHDLQQTDREAFSKYLDGLGVDVASFVGRNKVRVATQFGDLIFNAETKKVVAAKGEELQRLVGKTAEQAATSLDAMAAAPAARRDLNTLTKLVDSRMGRIAGITKRDLQTVKEALQKNPEAGRVKLARTYDQIVAKIRKAMEDGRVSTKAGMERIEQLTEAKLRLYGYGSIDEATSSSGAKGGTSGKGGGGGGGGSGGSFQRGGTIVPGTGTGDKVPAMLEPGEGIINRRAVAAMGGPGAIHAINSAVPRFQDGGIAMPRWSSNYPVGQVSAGANNLLAGVAEALLRRAKRTGATGGAGKHRSYPFLSGDTDFVPALGMALSRMARAAHTRISVTSGWRSYAEQAALFAKYGSPRAAPPGRSNHEDGRAADISPGHSVFGGLARRFGLTFPMSWEPWHIELAQRGGVAGFRRGGLVPSRPLRGDHWVHGGRAKSPGGRLWTVDEAATLLWQVGASRGEAALLSRKLMGESGGNPHAHGPPDGRGLFQIERQFHPELRGLNLYNPIQNAAAALHVLRKQGIGAWYAPSGAAGRVRPEWTTGARKPKRHKIAPKPGKKPTGSTVTAEPDTTLADLTAGQWAVVAENARRGRASAGAFLGFGGSRLGTYQGGSARLTSAAPGSAGEPMSVGAPVINIWGASVQEQVTMEVTQGRTKKVFLKKVGRDSRRRAMGPGRG